MELQAGRAMDDEQHVSTTEARAGSTPHMTRYILVWGLLLVIVAFVAVLLVWR
jgi:Flp pilus assembly protein TadB